MNRITPLEVKTEIERGKEVLVMDVRGKHSVRLCPIGGNHVPYHEIYKHTEFLSQFKNKAVRIVCKTGRTKGVGSTTFDYLEAEGFQDVAVVSGGAMRCNNQLGRYRFPTLE